MRRFRIVIATAVIGLIAAGMPASADPQAGVHGGGFVTGPNGSKTHLSISAFDDLVLGDKGQAQFVQQTPGSKSDAVHITLGCVNVLGSTAVAAGFGADGRMYLVVVKDNGEGQGTRDAFAVVEMLGAPLYCMGGIIPVNAQLGSIQGGNFQVSNG